MGVIPEGFEARVDRIGEISIVDVDDAAEAFDRGDVWARVDKSTGYLHFKARAARTGVQVYSDGVRTWGEYRDAAEVFAPESMDSFRRIVATDDHPDAFVTADTAKALGVGFVADGVDRSGAWLVVEGVITDRATIDKIRAGKAELSAGYYQRPEPATGTHDGQAYTIRQTEIRANHLAVVDRARAGSQARIPTFDGRPVPVAATETDENMTDETKAPKAADTREDAPERSTPAPQGDRTPTADAATLARLDALEAENARLRDALEAERAGADARIDARVALVSVARDLAPEVDTAGRSDDEIRRAVIAEVAPDMLAKIDSRADVPGYLAAAFDLTIDRVRADRADIASGFARVAPSKGEPPKADPMRNETLDAAAALFAVAK